jgi:hypothetical protein
MDTTDHYLPVNNINVAGKTQQKNTELCDLVRYATAYLTMRWSPIPIPPKCKAPKDIGYDWQQHRLTLDDLQQKSGNSRDREKAIAAMFAIPDRNIGIILGQASGGLVDIDLDCKEAVDLAPQYLPPTGARFGRKFKPESHWLYKVAGDVPTVKHTCSNETLLELRGDGGAQTVFPPSVHPSGERIEWSSEDQPSSVEYAVLLEATKRLRDAILAKRGVDPTVANTLPVPTKKTLAAAPMPCNQRNIDKVRSALAVIPADIPHPQWRDLMFALSSLVADDPAWHTVAGDMFDAWSQTGGEKYDAGSNRTQWEHAIKNPEGGITIATLFHEAKERGWTPIRPVLAVPVNGNTAPAANTLSSWVAQSDTADLLNNFVAYLEIHQYIYMPTGKPWPAASVNARIEPIPMVDEFNHILIDEKSGNPKTMLPANWLDKNRAVEDTTWAPGAPRIVHNRRCSRRNNLEPLSSTKYLEYRRCEGSQTLVGAYQACLRARWFPYCPMAGATGPTS